MKIIKRDGHIVDYCPEKIETAIKNAEQFLQGGKINYPFLGVVVYDTPVEEDSDEPTGVMIEEVEEKSPAAKAGLQKNDRIIKINDYTIESSTLFKHYLYNTIF